MDVTVINRTQEDLQVKVLSDKAGYIIVEIDMIPWKEAGCIIKAIKGEESYGEITV